MSTIMRKSVDHVNQEGGDTSDDVVEALHAVMHLLRSRQHREPREGPHDVTHLEAKVLGFFARQPGATQSELAAHSGRDKGQLARLIGGLKERGLLEARVDESDRRNLRLYVTAQGQSLHQALHRQARRHASAAVAGLSQEERRQLVALLHKVRANIEAAP
jgi:DNA-binding MarR family transcriptional regulator